MASLGVARTRHGPWQGSGIWRDVRVIKMARVTLWRREGGRKGNGYMPIAALQERCGGLGEVGGSEDRETSMTQRYLEGRISRTLS